MKRAVVIGLGVIAANHLKAIEENPDIKLAAVCDIDPERTRAAPGTPFYRDYKEMIKKEKPDCVHMCLPHHLHYPVSRDVAAMGANIFAEKPLALNAAEGLEYTKLEARYGVHIGICFQNRWNATTEVLFKELTSGKYGKVTGVRGDVAWYRSKEYYEASPWRAKMDTAGGGVMINQSIHTMDLLQYFAGAPVVSIRGSIASLLDYPGLEVEDTVSALIKFQGGALGYFTATIANYTNHPVMIYVQCESAEFRIDSGRLYRINSGEPVLLAEDAAPSTGKAYYGSSHSKIIAEFYRVLETGMGTYVTPQEALVSMRMIDAVRESSRSGKNVVFDGQTS
jgi:predicted dehydrogenase